MSDHPRTLIELSGGTPAPAAWSRAALVLIDCQREYVDGRLPLPGIDPALDAVADLLARARAAGAPVVHIVQQGRPGGLFDPDGPGAALAPQAAPETGEAVIPKALPNAFAGTDLHARLRDLGRRDLVLAGFMTHMCVSASARAALDLGYATTVVAGATATRALPDPLGDTVPATALQRAALAALADRFATVVADADALAA